MSNEKPVELTEAERVRIVSASASRLLIIDVVTRIVAAREAAARREALLEAEAEANALRSQIDSAECASRCYRRELRGAEAKIARVEARLDEESPCLDRHLGAASCDHPGCVLERDIRDILAEPEAES